MVNIKRLNKLSRRLDKARKARRFANLVVGTYVLWCLGVAALWVVAFCWGFSGMGDPGVDKGSTMFGIIVGLFMLSAFTVFASIPVGVDAVDARREFDVAEEAYADELDNV